MLFQSMDDLPSQMNKNEMIVQRYIHDPLTLEDLKFDLRIYILVTGTTTLDAYLCSEGLGRFCTEAYEAPCKANFKDFFRHLTNYSINKHHDGYKESYEQEDSMNAANDNTKRTLTSCL